MGHEFERTRDRKWSIVEELWGGNLVEGDNMGVVGEL